MMMLHKTFALLALVAFSSLGVTARRKNHGDYRARYRGQWCKLQMRMKDAGTCGKFREQLQKGNHRGRVVPDPKPIVCTLDDGTEWEPSVGDIVIATLKNPKYKLRPWTWHHTYVVVPKWHNFDPNDKDVLGLLHVGYRLGVATHSFVCQLQPDMDDAYTFSIRKLSASEEFKTHLGDKLREFAASQNWKPWGAGKYNWKFAASLYPRALTLRSLTWHSHDVEFSDKKEWYCSELVAGAYQNAGLFPTTSAPGSYWPYTLLRKSLSFSPDVPGDVRLEDAKKITKIETPSKLGFCSVCAFRGTEDDHMDRQINPGLKSDCSYNSWMPASDQNESVPCNESEQAEVEALLAFAA